MKNVAIDDIVCRVQPVTTSNFGFLVAYLLPGYVALLQIGPIFLVEPPLESQWTLGGMLSVTVLSLVYGMIISATRWLVVDTIHHVTGITPKKWSFSKLEENINAYELVVRHQYQYYQFYSNMLIAGFIVFVRGAAGT